MAEGAAIGEPGRASPAIATLLRKVILPVARLAYRPTLEGIENLPADGPFLLVANHGAGSGAADILSFAALWLDQCGASRPLAGFAHPFGFRVWPISWLIRGLGAVPSTYAAGEATLAAGVPLLVFPGGDYEASQPIWLGHSVDFGGRTGFLKLARKANVPIVPMGFRGSHFPTPVVWRSRRVLAWLLILPRLIGLKRYPLTVLAVVGAAAIVVGLPELGAMRLLLAWAWVASPFSMLPWVPWSIRARIGTPILPGDWAGGGDEDLERALERVEGAVRELVAK